MSPPAQLSALRLDETLEESPARPAQPALHLAAPLSASQRFVWEGKFGTMVIEIRGVVAYVNDQAVEPFPPVEPPAG